jgi:hypothetical protein
MNHETNNDLEQRLTSLGDSIPASDRLTQNVMERIGNETPGASNPIRRNLHIGRWIMRGSIGLAACTLIGAFLWNVLITPARAYGIEDVRERLSKANSLYIAGKSSDGVAFEVYAQRPNKCYRMQTGHRIIQTAEKNMMIDDQAKTVTLTPGDALDARYVVESVLQSEMFDQLLGPPGEKMVKVRAERVGDIDTDVYENRPEVKGGNGSVRREIFLNPRTGLPVKTTLYVRPPGQPDEVELATIDRIEADGPPPTGAFDFAAPKGYQLREVPGDPADTRRAPTPLTGVHSDHGHFEVYYTLNLSDKAVLVCWSFYDDRKPAEDMKTPDAGTLSIAGRKGKYFDHLLRADKTPEGHHWRWSLLIPSDARLAVTDNAPSMTIMGRSVLSATQAPVTFERDELKQFVLDAQKRTLPENEKPLTLEEIEAKLKEVLEKTL